MKKFLKLSVYLLLFIIQLSLYAQKTYLKGYIITSTNDTVFGFINDKTPNKKDKSISFKNSLTDINPSTYSLNNVNGFFLEDFNESFFKKSVTIDKKPIDDNRLEEFPDQTFSVDTVFLRLLTSGTITLFYFLDETGKEHFFIERQGNETTELNLIKYLWAKGSVKTHEIYKQQLKKEFEDCAAIKNTDIPFTRSSLKKIVEKYNICVGAPSPKVLRGRRFKLKLGLLAGGSHATGIYSRMETYGIELKNYMSRASYNTSNSPVIGISLDLLLLRTLTTTKRISIGIDAFWKQHHYTGLYQKEDFFYTTDYQIKYDFSYLRTNYLLRYSFPGKVQPYLRAGFSVAYLFKHTNEVLEITPSNSKKYTNPTTFNSFDMGAIASAGIMYQKFSGEFRYDYTSLQATAKKIHFNTDAFYLILGYRFN